MPNDNWFPEIMYEEPSEEEALTSNIPFIPVPNNQEMPKLLYIFESRETGEFEPGPEGEELPVSEMELHQYADMAVLKSQLDLDVYDVIRSALDLEPMSSAVLKGKKITDRVHKNIQV